MQRTFDVQAVREQFPALGRTRNGRGLVYFVRETQGLARGTQVLERSPRSPMQRRRRDASGEREGSGGAARGARSSPCILAR